MVQDNGIMVQERPAPAVLVNRAFPIVLRYRSAPGFKHC